MDWLVEIKEDLFDIAHRLKELDVRYRVYRNLRANRFEIHANGALQLATPFDRLDARTLDLVRKTRLENADRLIGEIDKSNARLKRAEEVATREKIMTEVEKVL